MELVGLLVVVVILGALFGGESFGQVIRNGCGVLIALIGLLVAFVIFS